MRKRRRQHVFCPNGLDSLEGRLAPAALVPTVAPPTADVAQQGNFQGQFGDQTTPDVSSTNPGANAPTQADAEDNF